MKLIVFDWGGVVESHSMMYINTKNAWFNLLARYGAEPEEDFWRKLDEIKEDIEITLDIRQIKKWKERLEETFHISVGSVADFEKAYTEEFDKVFYYRDIVEYIHSLKGKCQLGIMSNLAKMDIERLDKQMKFSKFDYVWLSCVVHMKKPDEKIYHLAENVSGVEGKDILLIDDNEENTKRAAALGWNICLVTEGNLLKIKEEVEKFM